MALAWRLLSSNESEIYKAIKKTSTLTNYNTRLCCEHVYTRILWHGTTWCACAHLKMLLPQKYLILKYVYLHFRDCVKSACSQPSKNVCVFLDFEWLVFLLFAIRRHLKKMKLRIIKLLRQIISSIECTKKKRNENETMKTYSIQYWVCCWF